MATRLTIVADENIPLLDELFADKANIVRLPGRSMQASDLRQADALLVRSVTQVNADLLANSPVKFVGTCTIGFDHIDLPYLEKQQIGFSRAPGCNALAVVDYVLAALFAIQPSLSDWQNKTVGVLGFGEVGSRLCARLQALAIPFKVHDPFKSEAKHSLEEVLACNAISLHVPLSYTGEHATYHLLNAQRIAQLQPGTLLINSSRGKVVDNLALLQRLQDKSLRAVLDVYEDEPAPSEELLKALDIATAHIAGYSVHGKMRGTLQVAQQLFQQFALAAPSVDYLSQFSGEIDASEIESAAELIQQAYDIRQDSQAFLAQYLAAEPSQRAAVFDAYRKNYPTRLELGFITVKQAKPHLAGLLAPLGFS